MKQDIILSGVGGQGILSIAAVIGMSAMEAGLNVKQAEVHGMSQRGGAVQSHLRLSDQEIYSDLIPAGNCDMILSVEPMEGLRYLPFLDSNGWIITNSRPVKNIDHYPDVEHVYNQVRSVENHILIDADDLAAKLGTRKVSNIVILGAASLKLGIQYAYLENSIQKLFERKGDEIVTINIKALEAGRAAASVHA